MNYLAHLYFADRDDQHRLGNLAGDWIKGRLENQPLPPRLRDGARRHRFVDSFSDRHPATAAARERLGAERRRASGIILDVVNDHFLVRHWDAYADTTLPAFLASNYASLRRTRPLWPTPAAPVLERIIAGDWLGRYRDLAFTAAALDRVGARMRRDPGLADVLPVLEREYDALEEAFHALMASLAHALRPR